MHYTLIRLRYEIFSFPPHRFETFIDKKTEINKNICFVILRYIEQNSLSQRHL